MPTTLDYTDLIHSVFAPTLEIVTRLKPAKGLTDPDEAARFFDVDTMRLWAKIGGALRKIKAKDYPSDLRDSLEAIATVRRDTERQCKTVGKTVVFLANRLDLLADVADQGWIAATHGGVTPRSKRCQTERICPWLSLSPWPAGPVL